MKVVLLMLVALVVVLPVVSGWRGRKWFRERVKDRFKAWAYKKLKGKRDTEGLDANQDGELDETELQQVLEERDVKSLLDAMNVDDTISVEEFERNLREMDDTDLDDQ
ncbi:uncharacterized protein [Haliotis cracherodii]|uniref:uncharacterized protein n=1 Tax=Haliotis cracherodii TaxID=6455 RepID=UPI0039ED69B3